METNQKDLSIEIDDETNIITLGNSLFEMLVDPVFIINLLSIQRHVFCVWLNDPEDHGTIDIQIPGQVLREPIPDEPNRFYPKASNLFEATQEILTLLFIAVTQTKGRVSFYGCSEVPEIDFVTREIKFNGYHYAILTDPGYLAVMSISGNAWLATYGEKSKIEKKKDGYETRLSYYSRWLDLIERILAQVGQMQQRSHAFV